MRGHIVQRSKGTYSIKISLGKDPTTGKYKSQWFTVKGSKRDTEKRLSEILHQLDTGTFMKPGKTTVAEYLQRWLVDYGKPNLSPRSYERYESIVRVHLLPSLGNISLVQLRPEYIQRHYNNMLKAGLSARTIRYHHVVLHKALQTAIKWGLLVRNVADGVDVPHAHSKEIQTWQEHELSQFLNAARDTAYYALFYTALFTGMRRSELLALRWQDIDLILGQISVCRGLHHLKDGSYIFTQLKSVKSYRTIALSPSAIITLQEHWEKQVSQAAMLGLSISSDSLVFSTFDGKPLRPNTISRAWHNLAAKAGVRVIRFHDARHTHASIMLKQGIHPKIVQERLGHSTISITLDTYSHVAPGLQEAAAKRFDDAIQINHNKSVVEKV